MPTLWSRTLSHLRRPTQKFVYEPALRAELFSAAQMAAHGHQLAQQHQLNPSSKPGTLLSRLYENEALLARSCTLLSEVPVATRRATPAAEWLLDNFYLIEEQIRTARKHLPKGYNRELPRLGNGPSSGLPRVYDIALETISHGDGRFDSESLCRFVAAYQSVTPLTLGELWAIPIMLRLALVENLRRVASRVMANWDDRNLANDWADLLSETAEQDPKSVVLSVADLARSQPPMSSSFVAELTRRLQGQNAALTLPLTWVEQVLAASGQSSERLVQLDTQQQAADQVSISNSISSLRLLSASDWRSFVERMSHVEQVLSEDPAGVYPSMDFATRDHYRHVVERLAKHSAQTEEQVARLAIELASTNQGLAAHVGFYLLGEGLKPLEQRLGVRLSLTERWQRVLRRAPLAFFLGPALLLSVLLAWPFLASARTHGLSDMLLALLSVPALLMTSCLALGLVNWLVTLTVTPDTLPRLDYSSGIPAQSRTLVVIPTLMDSAADVEELVEGLEVRFLANRDSNLHFALLTDFMDAPSAELEQDAALLLLARNLIEALNLKYPAGEAERFYLLHRPRRWNPAEGVWMGQERKRGKLAALNALLRGQGQEQFTMIAGAIDALPKVNYVITLDTDTQLPRDVAKQLVGALAHPLNHAVFDADGRNICSGYAILQPRVGISLPSSARSAYAQLFGSDAGVDPYTRAVSDVYQDLFRHGSFVGKGIYAVDAFEHALEGCFPDNRILSHDLIEGCYACSGLLSDVQLYEEHPASYSADCKRRHRWIRGDWQLLPWLLPWIAKPQGGLQRNRLDALARWKILDNLRRSLEPVAFLTMLLCGWLALPLALHWNLAVLALVLTQPVLGSLLELLRKPHDIPLMQHLRATARSAAQHFSRALLALVWLPAEALLSVDAIVRTLWRVLVSRKRLLQWSPSREVERSSHNDLAGLYRLMWVAPLTALLTSVLLLPTPWVLLLASPLLLFWLASPAIAWHLSRPSIPPTFTPSADEQLFLSILARKTWAFFDDHVGPHDNWLPPDNIQEQPTRIIAHRTSPTNMGMALLAHLAAYDFGYLSAGRLLTRLDKSLTSMAGLERHRQHFFNWYDTQTLKPLPPHYVSTVDSGNLAGLLLTLRPGLLELADQPVLSAQTFNGLSDTLAALQEALTQEQLDTHALYELQDELERACTVAPPNLPNACQRLQGLLDGSQRLLSTLHTRPGSGSERWLQALIAHCQDLHGELSQFLLPPLAAPEQPAQRTWRQLSELDSAQWPLASQAPVLRVKCYARERIDRAERLAQQAGSLAQMEFGFLYDPQRDLFSIGYNTEEDRLDSGYYDLLASEARLTNFVVIAQGQLPQEGWFTLGRLLTSNHGVPVLLSWSGSMFEYLMPMLVMPSHSGTLLDQTCRAAVARQIEYGNQLGLPWGISESGYNTLDAHFNYQYRAFGVPGLGLKRGLGEDIVIAPYASALALMVEPHAACKNLQRLAELGLSGPYGLYEAIDYTPARLPRGQSTAVIHSFMAHHQGMSLLALAYVLLDRPMQRRFESDPQFQATALLLQERIPKTAAQYLHAAHSPAADAAARASETKLRVFTDPGRRRPAVQLLSNGHYHVMLSSAGGGYSRCDSMAVTRWQEDISRDHWGMFCYLRDVSSGAFWSAAHQPTLRKTASYEAIFTDARAEFRVREEDYDAHSEIVVSPEDNIELRRLHLTNRAQVRRTLELTSYAEVVLAPAIADALHPAFSKLFVQTELLPQVQAILCSRRPRSSQEATPWMCHLLAAHGVDIDAISYETDRAQFIGRGRSAANPAALDAEVEHLSGSAGSVLDPIVAIRCRITLDPGQTAVIDLVSGVSESREGCLQLIDKYRDRHLADRVFDLAWTHSQVLLRQLNAAPVDARLFEQLAASILYANASLRADPSLISGNQRNQSGLWGQAISGDLPIVLLQIADPTNIELVRQLVQAHAYWRQKGLALDLVIWNEDQAGYRQHLQDLIMALVTSSSGANLLDRPGGIFVRPAQQLSSEDRLLMLAVARVVLSDQHGSLAEQLHRRTSEPVLPRFDARQLRTPQRSSARPVINNTSLALSNPFGGFSADGSEYVIQLAEGVSTPAPWANVLANPDFGTIISESGGAYTWSENAHEYRLTPWHNEPLSDASDEAFYLRDDESGHYWSPTPLPRPGTGSYTTRHGFGYSVFEHEEDGIHSELWVYVALDASIKFSRLSVRNQSGRTRRLSATGYVAWVLGDLREKSAMHIVTEQDPICGALFARNAYSIDFPGRVAFFDADSPTRTVSADRSEFLGRNGNLNAPAAMSKPHLSGRTGGGLDPCAAIQVAFELADGGNRDIIFRLGAGRTVSCARHLAQTYRSNSAAACVLKTVRRYWCTTLNTIQIKTPEPAIDVLVNGWLMYQVIASRFWARSGYYQSGGAYGFRDQLQDSMAMLHANPAASRQHLLLCAAHQFIEGDVQHWWHPPLNRGVRTGCSDDYLWLALATSRYVLITGDQEVLDEQVHYIEGRALNAGEESYYDLPRTSTQQESLYQHCVRAIEHSMSRGAHGLPLIGCGDWNDGMNRVGEQGQGESVWLGFFLYEVLQQFAETARSHGDAPFAQRCLEQAESLRLNLEAHGWDGAWYRRAYFDDGTPLGSAANEECRIDSIAQSWSVLSAAAAPDRQHIAIDALDKHLLRRDLGLIKLLEPPFDQGTLDPGYIKGYVPGVRENGGQYTHAAVWAGMAFARLGDSARAWEVLRLINPVSHGNATTIEQYKVEPYVVSADVYGVAPHAGRGGWSWYTGAAGWMYRFVVESLLGVQRIGNNMRLQPLLPANWPGFSLDYRFGSTLYRIEVHQAADATPALHLDGVRLDGPDIPLLDDAREHRIELHCRPL
ncbi:MAG: cyclic beta 1-2 glucan synthetase [Gammaproteobacteria bacterium]|nr:cyclic beta 1-2 glucan synthetase [Gammaproteobacteria bacterium]MBU2080300.1 cyclic beta 1-2 glucan synthetase [Alphaproteobacteria bacterium]MBU1489424.1 cyclic beta 1-2 glucan synthetase [Gammaproteobacteria bacterium]MBU2156704.1 cyclic beta 1-2 glucan synthetase [Gammaproteobacteria bacterium]MBU2253216.1 cyclic beta 1-2 glucan synthetase [Gammaproteobacteria bacterium]